MHLFEPKKSRIQPSQKTYEQTDGQIDGRKDGHTYYTVTQGILTRCLRTYALRAITGCANELLLPIKSRFSKKNRI